MPKLRHRVLHSTRSISKLSDAAQFLTQVLRIRFTYSSHLLRWLQEGVMLFEPFDSRGSESLLALHITTSSIAGLPNPRAQFINNRSPSMQQRLIIALLNPTVRVSLSTFTRNHGDVRSYWTSCHPWTRPSQWDPNALCPRRQRTRGSTFAPWYAQNELLLIQAHSTVD